MPAAVLSARAWFGGEALGVPSRLVPTAVLSARACLPPHPCNRAGQHADCVLHADYMLKVWEKGVSSDHKVNKHQVTNMAQSSFMGWAADVCDGTQPPLRTLALTKKYDTPCPFVAALRARARACVWWW